MSQSPLFFSLGLALILAAPMASQAESLAKCEYVEATRSGKILAKCDATAATADEAISMMRKGCLEWLIRDQLLATEAEYKRYQAVSAKIHAKLDVFVEAPKPGSRSGKGVGIVSRSRTSDNRISMAAILLVDKPAVLEALKAAKVIENPASKLRLVLVANKRMQAEHARLLNTMLAKALADDTLEIVVPGRMPGIEQLSKALAPLDAEAKIGLHRALAARADLILEYEVKRIEGHSMAGPSIAFQIRMELTETTYSRLVAAEVGLGQSFHLGQAGMEERALLELATDLTSKLKMQFDKALRSDGVGDGLLVVLRGKAPAKMQAYHSLLKKHCERARLAGEAVDVITLYARKCPADRKPLFAELRELAGKKTRFLSNLHNVILIGSKKR